MFVFAIFLVGVGPDMNEIRAGSTKAEQKSNVCNISQSKFHIGVCIFFESYGG